MIHTCNGACLQNSCGVTKRQNFNPEFDLFIPLMGKLPLKDQRKIIERPFFKLQKRKRVKTIDHKSPGGETRVKMEAIPAYGLATIRDADILIWVASTLNRMREQGINDLLRTLHTRDVCRDFSVGSVPISFVRTLRRL